MLCYLLTQHSGINYVKELSFNINKYHICLGLSENLRLIAGCAVVLIYTGSYN